MCFVFIDSYTGMSGVLGVLFLWLATSWGHFGLSCWPLLRFQKYWKNKTGPQEKWKFVLNDLFDPQARLLLNVGLTIINHPFGNGLYDLFMSIYGDYLIGGMVYFCYTHITSLSRPVCLGTWLTVFGSFIRNVFRKVTAVITFLCRGHNANHISISGVATHTMLTTQRFVLQCA